MEIEEQGEGRNGGGRQRTRQQQTKKEKEKEKETETKEKRMEKKNRMWFRLRAVWSTLPPPNRRCEETPRTKKKTKLITKKKENGAVNSVKLGTP